MKIEVRTRSEFYDSVSTKVKKDIADLGIKGVKRVEYIDVYTLRGDIRDNDAIKIASDLLADKISQEFVAGKCFSSKGKEKHHVVEIAYNPGVMDPVEESALKAVRDMGFVLDEIKTTKKYVIYGDVATSVIRDIADRILYNKVIQHMVKGEEEHKNVPEYKFVYKEVDILNTPKDELRKLSLDRQLYLSAVEMESIQEHFRHLGRNPSDCELETLAQTWSEHCKHKTLMGIVEYNGLIIDNLLKETIMRVTRELDKPWCVSVFVDNAGVIKYDKENNICFKVETHNHPSALEPYGGAETGVGGVLRDIMGTGLGAKPIANTDVFCFGLPDAPASSIAKGALHPKRVMKGVVSGVRDYGNKMGIPTVNGSVCFDERYTGNPLVFCGSIGIMPVDACEKQVDPGDLIVAVGGRTGRDGIHGATFSSAELTSSSEVISSTAVQIGNPITEKKILDTLLVARDKRLYGAITDCGAGGFSSAVGEMGEETGAVVYLEKIPLKYKGLEPWEIWISEAQERMVISVKSVNKDELFAIFESEGVEAVVIGEFTGDKQLRLYYEGNKVADIDMRFLHKGLPKTVRKAVWKAPDENGILSFRGKKDLTNDLLKILSSWNVCSKEWIIRQYDHEVQGGSILKPLVGAENDGPSDASVIRPVLGSYRGVAVSNGINPNYGDIDPYWMAASAIDEALRQITAVGGDIEKTALLDNFCWGNTEKPEQLGGAVRAAQACYDMAKVFGTPFISGKDSLNNEFNTGKKVISIPPTLLISAIAVVDDIRKLISMDAKAPGDLLYIVGETANELGGSRYLLSKGVKSGIVPRVDPEMSLSIMRKVTQAIARGYVRAAHDLSEGGLAVALAETLFAGGFGARIDLKKVPLSGDIERDDVILFSESNSRFILEVPAVKRNDFERTISGIPLGMIGRVASSPWLVVKGIKGDTAIKADLARMKKEWQKPIKEVMHG
ncbi:MAG: phosphoribosylformylglycinamidine synthase subunit PurL [Candidatus Omnitrophica bacterium]|nr:phosphoribosylformylglycinamidine synthase subunit PurL [Candidatus Omnitrophota bacterium]